MCLSSILDLVARWVLLFNSSVNGDNKGICSTVGEDSDEGHEGCVFSGQLRVWVLSMGENLGCVWCLNYKTGRWSCSYGYAYGLKDISED